MTGNFNYKKKRKLKKLSKIRTKIRIKNYNTQAFNVTDIKYYTSIFIATAVLWFTIITILCMNILVKKLKHVH